MMSVYERLRALFYDDSVLRQYWGEILKMKFRGCDGKPGDFQVRFGREPDVGLTFWFVKRESDWALQVLLARLRGDGAVKKTRTTFVLDNPVLLFVVIDNAYEIRATLNDALDRLR